LRDTCHDWSRPLPYVKEYQSTPAPTDAQYYTLMLFKRNMNRPDGSTPTRQLRRVFPTSRMGRYGDGVAGMACGGGRELNVMTSHLESFISKEDTGSAERGRQMKDSFKV